MKAYVSASRGGKSVLLTEEGIFVETEGSYRVGQELTVDRNGKVVPEAGRSLRKRVLKTAVAAAASVGIVFGAFDGLYMNAFAASYVSLDAEASIEYALNRRSRVISCSALNTHSESLADELNESGIRGTGIREAIGKTVELMQQRDQIVSDDQVVVAAVTSDAEVEDQLLTEASAALQDKLGKDTSAKVVAVTEKERQAAKEEGVGAGRYELEKRADSATAKDSSKDGGKTASDTTSASASSAQGSSASGQTGNGQSTGSSASAGSSSASRDSSKDKTSSNAKAGTAQPAQQPAAAAARPAEGGSSSTSNTPAPASKPADEPYSGPAVQPVDPNSQAAAQPTKPGSTTDPSAVQGESPQGTVSGTDQNVRNSTETPNPPETPNP